MTYCTPFNFVHSKSPIRYKGNPLLRKPITKVAKTAQKAYYEEGVRNTPISLEVHTLNGEKDIAYAEAAYCTSTGNLIIPVNPTKSIPEESIGTKYDFSKEKEKILRKKKHATVLSDLVSLYKQEEPRLFYMATSAGLETVEIASAMLDHIGNNATQTKEASEITEDTSFLNAYQELASAYARNSAIQKYNLLPNVIHELSHKILFEQTDYIKISARLKQQYNLDKAHNDAHKVFMDVYGKGLLQEVIQGENPHIFQSVYRAYLDIKEKCVAEQFGPVAAEQFKALTRVKAFDENLAKIITHKITGKEDAYDETSYFLYLKQNTPVLTSDYEKLQEFLNKNKYAKLLEKPILETVAQFSKD